VARPGRRVPTISVQIVPVSETISTLNGTARRARTGSAERPGPSARASVAAVTTPGQPRFLRTVGLKPGAPTSGYPYELAAVQGLGELPFGAVTVLAGDNGSGKSTVIEAIAVATGFNAEGGGRNLRFETHATHSELAEWLHLRWAKRPSWGWFLRAETFYGMATHIANDPELQKLKTPFPELHARSHGQSFLALADSRFADRGLYLMDEPESALSIQGQMRLLRLVHDGVARGAQFVLATHSPLLMSLPGALIYELSDDGIERVAYDEVRAVGLWRTFMANPDRLLDPLLSEDDDSDGDADDIDDGNDDGNAPPDE
jgi:predicted ATPase